MLKGDKSCPLSTIPIELFHRLDNPLYFFITHLIIHRQA